MKYGFEQSVRLYTILLDLEQKERFNNMMKALFSNDRNLFEKAFVELEHVLMHSKQDMAEGHDKNSALAKARREILQGSVHNNARNIVFYCGLHVENVVRAFMERQTEVTGWRYTDSHLKDAMEAIKKADPDAVVLSEALEHMLVLYGVSRIMINENTKKEMQPVANDALMAYAASVLIESTLSEK